MNTRALAAFGLLIGVQALDILVHVSTGQIEPMRIASNAIISVGAIAVVLAIPSVRAVTILAGVTYLALNVVFLVQHGLINPATGAMRAPLFGFVVVSLLLMIWLRSLLKTKRPHT